MTRCSTAVAAEEEKDKKRPGTELAVEASKVIAAEEVEGEVPVEKMTGVEAAVEKKKKWRMPQDLIDFILAWDVSDYVFSTPDNMDDMPLSKESKERYRAERKETVAVMQQHRRTKKKMQDWVKSEMQKHGYVEIDTTADMLEVHQLEEYIDGQTA